MSANVARVLAILLLTFAISTPSGAAPRVSRNGAANIQIEIFSGGFILGGAGGSGTLSYGGKRYPLNVGGISVGATIGASATRLGGRAYNLRRLTDIEGTYTATGVGYAIVAGRRITRLKNSRGVVLELSGRQVGLELSADVSGMTLSLK